MLRGYTSLKMSYKERERETILMNTNDRVKAGDRRYGTCERDQGLPKVGCSGIACEGLGGM